MRGTNHLERRCPIISLPFRVAIDLAGVVPELGCECLRANRDVYFVCWLHVISSKFFKVDHNGLHVLEASQVVVL